METIARITSLLIDEFNIPKDIVKIILDYCTDNFELCLIDHTGSLNKLPMLDGKFCIKNLIKETNSKVSGMITMRRVDNKYLLMYSVPNTIVKYHFDSNQLETIGRCYDVVRDMCIDVKTNKLFIVSGKGIHLFNNGYSNVLIANHDYNDIVCEPSSEGIYLANAKSNDKSIGFFSFETQTLKYLPFEIKNVWMLIKITDDCLLVIDTDQGMHEYYPKQNVTRTLKTQISYHRFYTRVVYNWDTLYVISDKKLDNNNYWNVGIDAIKYPFDSNKWVNLGLIENIPWSFLF